MKWGEIDYFFDQVKNDKKDISLLDIGCGNGRLLELMRDSDIKVGKYLGVDNSLGLLEEAKKLHPHNDFQLLDMHDISKISQSYDAIFFIASFHHLESVEERENVLLSAYALLKTGGKLCMTNWALESEVHKEKYKSSKQEGSENMFGSTDYNIKFGEFDRYYHCFTLGELEKLSECSGFEIQENRLFDNKKNFITILTK